MIKIRKLQHKIKNLKKTEEEIVAKIANTEADTNEERQQDNVEKQFQQMELYSACFGITDVEKKSSTILKFHPTFEGKMYGPFEVTLDPAPNQSFKIQSYQLIQEGSFAIHKMPQIRKKRLLKRFKQQPYNVVPLEKLQIEYLASDNLNLGRFAKSVAVHLRCYISRRQQVIKFDDLYREKVRDLEYNDEVSEVTFGVKIDDVEELDSTGVPKSTVLKLKLTYEMDRELPRIGSLAFQLDDGDDLGDEAVENLKEECEIFYSKPLSEAMALAFGD